MRVRSPLLTDSQEIGLNRADFVVPFLVHMQFVGKVVLGIIELVYALKGELVQNGDAVVGAAFFLGWKSISANNSSAADLSSLPSG